MKFRNYLEMLFGSKLKVKVLRALWKHKGKEFTVRELSGFLEVSHMGARKALADLEKANAIRIRTLGRTHAIALNEDSYAGHIVERMFSMEEETIDELVALLGEQLNIPEIKSAALFGSVVRGQELPFSDIDLFILTNDKGKAEEAVSNLQHEIAVKFGNTLVPYYLSEAEFIRKKNTPVVRQVLNDHTMICGKPLE